MNPKGKGDGRLAGLKPGAYITQEKPKSIARNGCATVADLKFGHYKPEKKILGVEGQHANYVVVHDVGD
jgi:hypothetical protein